MPKTPEEKKTLKQFKEEYGPDKGEQVYFALRNKNKKFDRSQGGGYKDKAKAKANARGKKQAAVWWAGRLNRLPAQIKMKLIGTLKANKSLSWWINRLDTFQTHCGGNHVAKAEHEGHLVTKDGKKHLPTHSNGKPNHRLMGAAWAALHGGYRGNKYEGPDKQTAISKLKRLYRKEGLTPPSEK